MFVLHVFMVTKTVFVNTEFQFWFKHSAWIKINTEIKCWVFLACGRELLCWMCFTLWIEDDPHIAVWKEIKMYLDKTAQLVDTVRVKRNKLCILKLFKQHWKIFKAGGIILKYYCLYPLLLHVNHVIQHRVKEELTF